MLRWSCLALLATPAAPFRLPEEKKGALLPGRPQDSSERWWEEWEEPRDPRVSLNEWSGPQSPSGWVVQRTPGQRAYFDIHIPKTAGTSWSRDVRMVIPEGEGYHSDEVCFANAGRMQPGDKVVVFLRRPMAHVYSQFLECKYSSWGRERTKDESAHLLRTPTTWLKSFDGGRNRKDLDCYHPFNMMTRSLSCNRTNKFASHHYHDEPSVKLAKRNLAGAFFVGIMEHYQASLCLFHWKTHLGRKPLPSYCNCRDHEAWGKFDGFRVTHNLPPHSVADLSQMERDMIGELTAMDVDIYHEGLMRFRQETAQVEKITGTRILCD